MIQDVLPPNFPSNVAQCRAHRHDVGAARQALQALRGRQSEIAGALDRAERRLERVVDRKTKQSVEAILAGQDPPCSTAREKSQIEAFREEIEMRRAALQAVAPDLVSAAEKVEQTEAERTAYLELVGEILAHNRRAVLLGLASLAPHLSALVAADRLRGELVGKSFSARIGRDHPGLKSGRAIYDRVATGLPDTLRPEQLSPAQIESGAVALIANVMAQLNEDTNV